MLILFHSHSLFVGDLVDPLVEPAGQNPNPRLLNVLRRSRQQDSKAADPAAGRIEARRSVN